MVSMPFLTDLDSRAEQKVAARPPDESRRVEFRLAGARMDEPIGPRTRDDRQRIAER